MSVDTIIQELTKLTPVEQKEVREFLYELSSEQDREYRAQISRRLDNEDPDYWIPVEVAIQRLGFSEDGFAGLTITPPPAPPAFSGSARG